MPFEIQLICAEKKTDQCTSRNTPPDWSKVVAMDASAGTNYAMQDLRNSARRNGWHNVRDVGWICPQCYIARKGEGRK